MTDSDSVEDYKHTEKVWQTFKIYKNMLNYI